LKDFLSPTRPVLTHNMTVAEFRRWYWMKDELIAFARELAVATSGNKPELADRIAAVLDGREPTAPMRPGPES
jgi:hypothetical protein